MLKALRATGRIIPKAARVLEVPVSTGSSVSLLKFISPRAPICSTSTRSTYSQNTIINNVFRMMTKGGFNNLEVISTSRGAIVNLGQGDGVIQVTYLNSFTLKVNGRSIEFKGAGKEKVIVIGKDIIREPILNIIGLLGMAGVLAMGAGVYFFDRKSAVTDNKVKTISSDGSDEPITEASKPQLK